MPLVWVIDRKKIYKTVNTVGTVDNKKTKFFLGTVDNKKTKMMIQLEQKGEKHWQLIAELEGQTDLVGHTVVVIEK